MSRLWLPLSISLLAWGAPPLTTIQDLLYRADGTTFSGIALIEWSSFEAGGTSNVAGGSLSITIAGGVLRVQLAAGGNYTVRYNSGGKTQFTEIWNVPLSATPLRLRSVRTMAGPVTGGALTAPVPISDVTGLAGELAARPVMGPGFAASRTAVISAAGQLEAASGDPVDCLRVDGTSGPCGSTGGTLASFVDGDTPAGAVDGANGAFTLSSAPSPASSLLLYRNGILQKRGLDYSLSGNAIVFAGASIPQTGDVLLASYRVSGSGTGTRPEILCIGSGAATSQATPVSLAQCTIPGGTLKTGDRVEIRFDVSHEGTASGFTLDVKWGATGVATRSAASAETLLTGRAEVSVQSGGAQWSSQTWGGTSALAAAAGTSAETGVSDLLVDFQGQTAAAGTDTVTLRNYLVLRHPVPASGL
ncbi:MAG: hypothetical protein HY822_15005 [Acidobacteria bacterium]|nr:hypothetical protein [Acidobacteriota bacterium]